MYSPTPIPPSMKRSSKLKSPRRTTDAVHPRDIHSYLTDIAKRKGCFSHPLKNFTTPSGAEHIRKNRDSDSDSDSNDKNFTRGSPVAQNRHHEVKDTATMLFEKSPMQKLANELAPNRFHEFDNTPPPFKGPNTIVLEHTLAKRDRSAHFVIREHHEGAEGGSCGALFFSVHVFGPQQRFSFRVPPTQVTACLVLCKSPTCMCLHCFTYGFSDDEFLLQRIACQLLVNLSVRV